MLVWTNNKQPYKNRQCLRLPSIEIEKHEYPRVGIILQCYVRACQDAVPAEHVVVTERGKVSIVCLGVQSDCPIPTEPTCSNDLTSAYTVTDFMLLQVCTIHCQGVHGACIYIVLDRGIAEA